MKNSEIMNLEVIKDGLQDKRLYTVAERTGVSYPTLKKLYDGEQANYTIDTLKKVTRYLLNSLNEG